MPDDIQEIVTLYDREVRIELEDPDMEREVLAHVVRLVREEPPMGFIRRSWLDEQNADGVIREQMAYFSARGMPFEWEVCAYDQPWDLKERLLEHGFRPDLEEDDTGAVLVLDLQDAPASLTVPVSVDVPLSGEVRQIEDIEALADVVRVEEQVWGGEFDWLQERLGRHLSIPAYLAVFAAYVDGEPASCGWTYYYAGSQFAILRGGSTLPALRRQGLYSAILAARVQHALRRGYRFLIVDAAPSSRPILEKNGFQVLTYSESFKWGQGV